MSIEKQEYPEAPDRYELAARMKFVEGKTWAQIARELDIPRGGALERLKRRLRRDLRKAIVIMAIINKK